MSLPKRMSRGFTPSTPADRAPSIAPHPSPRHREEGGIADEVEQVTEPTIEGHRSPIGAAWSGSPVPWPRLLRASAMVRRCSPATSWHASPSLRTRWVPSPCGRLSRPRTTTDPPPHPGAISRRWACPPSCGLHEGKDEPRDGSHVHHVPVGRVGAQLFRCGLATTTPQAFTVASWSACITDFGVVSPSRKSTRTAAQPTSTRLELVPLLSGFNHWFTLVTPFCLACRAQSRLAVPTRPGVVRAASHPPEHLLGQAALSFTGLLRQPGEAGLSPASGYTAPRGALSPGGTDRPPGWRRAP